MQISTTEELNITVESVRDFNAVGHACNGMHLKYEFIFLT